VSSTPANHCHPDGDCTSNDDWQLTPWHEQEMHGSCLKAPSQIAPAWMQGFAGRVELFHVAALLRSPALENTESMGRP
jgi:hypothetical protein